MLDSEFRSMPDASGRLAAATNGDPVVSAPVPGPHTRFDLETAPGATQAFDSATDLRNAVLTGSVPRSSRVCTVAIASDGAATEGPWTTVETMAKGHSELRAMYRPIWDHTMRFVSYGMITGCVLKGLDTTVLLFSADAGLGVAWLFVVASLVASTRWPMAPLVAAFLCFKLGVASNLFVTVLGVAVVGCALGAPAGMLVGTVVGHFRRNRLKVAPDMEPEGRRTYVLGAVLPGVGLTVAVPLYVWLSIKAFEWMS